VHRVGPRLLEPGCRAQPPRIFVAHVLAVVISVYPERRDVSRNQLVRLHEFHDHAMRCPHCPLDRSLRCRGEEVRRFCELVDPSGPDYRREYARILAGDDHVVTAEEREALAESAKRIGGAPSGTPCCGGNPYETVDP
jgi:hypothetical protein